MLSSSVRRLIVLGCVMQVTTAGAMMYQNRFIPLFDRPLLWFEGAQSFYSMRMLYATSNRSIGTGDSPIHMPSLFGSYDQGIYARAQAKIGLPDLLPSEWRNDELIPWAMDGKRQAQGFVLAWDLSLCDIVSPQWAIGGSMLFMHVNSRSNFILSGVTNLVLTEDDRYILDRVRREMFEAVDLYLGNTVQFGFGDIDMYLRYGNSWEYISKFRRIDAGFRLGLIAPTGVMREIDRPLSIPFGGDGHWGLYGVGEALFEVKDDIRVGLYARLQKLLPRTLPERLPVAGEPIYMGVLTGDIYNNPGFTVILQPYVSLTGLRPGLGINAIYTLTAHQRDNLSDRRSNCDLTPIELNRMEDLSKWGTDYISVFVYYDFDHDNDPRSFKPIVSFEVDIPNRFYTAFQSDETYRVLLGIEYAF